MRDLNNINFVAQSTRTAFIIALGIPIIFGAGAWALADGAAPTLVLRENHLKMASVGIILLALLSMPVSYLFRWNWEAKYFGASVLPVASGSIIGIYPLLCIICYGTLPLLIRVAFGIVSSFAIIRWCARFVISYKSIYQNNHLFSYIYEEEADAVYYLQEADKKISNGLAKIDLFPDPKYVLFFLLVALLLTPFAPTVSQFIGVPFPHIFLAVSAAPLNLMFIGMATKMWLVYCFYPRKIQKRTNKPVFVDMSSKPRKS